MRHLSTYKLYSANEGSMPLFTVFLFFLVVAATSQSVQADVNISPVTYSFHRALSAGRYNSWVYVVSVEKIVVALHCLFQPFPEPQQQVSNCGLGQSPGCCFTMMIKNGSRAKSGKSLFQNPKAHGQNLISGNGAPQRRLASTIASFVLASLFLTALIVAPFALFSLRLHAENSLLLLLCRLLQARFGRCLNENNSSLLPAHIVNSRYPSQRSRYLLPCQVADNPPVPSSRLSNFRALANIGLWFIVWVKIMLLLSSSLVDTVALCTIPWVLGFWLK